MTRVVASACMVVLLAACEASFPITPTEPVPLALQLHFTQPLGQASIRNGYSFTAYVIRSDGAWEEVTNQVAWSSPNPAVFRSSGSGRFIADNLGTSGVIAQYQALSASVDIVVVDPTRLPTPRLSVTTVAPQTGATLQSVSALVPITGSSRDVTGEATWTSSDPLVATVETGRVTARGPGTTRITVTHQGMTASYVFSVRPPAR